jgi:hypothetical protein
MTGAGISSYLLHAKTGIYRSICTPHVLLSIVQIVGTGDSLVSENEPMIEDPALEVSCRS